MQILILNYYRHKKNIYTQVHYIPICNQPFYKNCNLVTQEVFPNVNKYYRECLSLPMYPSISEEELNEVVNALKEFYK